MCRTLFGASALVPEWFGDLLAMPAPCAGVPAVEMHPSPSLRAPSATEWDPAPLGAFSPADDGVWFRSHSGITAHLGAQGRSIIFEAPAPGAPGLHTASVAVDELGALARDLRGDLCLHAATLVSPTGRAVVLLGDSGTGKSTAAAIAASHAGWSAAADDSLVAELVDGTLRVVPSYPGIRLGERSVAVLRSLGVDVEWDQLPHCRTGDKRRLLPHLPSSSGFAFHHGAVDVAAIVDLRPGSGGSASARLAPCPASEMVRRVLWAAFAVPCSGREADIRRFEQAVDAVAATTSITAHYPKSAQGVVALLDRLAML